MANKIEEAEVGVESASCALWRAHLGLRCEERNLSRTKKKRGGTKYYFAKIT